MKEDFNPKKNCILNLFETGAQLPNLSTFSISFQRKLSKLPQNGDFKDLFTRLAGNVANSDKKLNAHYEHYEHFE